MTPQEQQLLRQLQSDPPISGRHIAEDGLVFNMADYARSDPRAIARGLWPGAEGLGAYGLRTSTGIEERFPIWPDGANVGVAYDGGTQLEIVSTGAGSADDAPGGNGMAYVSIHYLDANLEPQELVVEMNGATPVPLPVDDVTFVQCMHTSERDAGYAAGSIVLRAVVGGAVFSQIAVGAPRCSSAFRMVPKGKRLYIDGAVGSSVSATADVPTAMFIVANEIFNHQYRDPVIWIPFGATGVQNGSVAFNFPLQQSFKEGTIVGGLHSSTKAGTFGLTWVGHLEPVDGTDHGH